MGYTTKFKGAIDIKPAIEKKHAAFVNGLMNSRRMKRDVSKLPPVDESINPLATHGEEGEFYFDPTSKSSGQFHEKGVADFNAPPSTQPSLWLQWEITEDGKLQWNGAEKFYGYRAWLTYLIDKVFAPLHYTLDGRISYKGEDREDRGYLTVENNKVTKTCEPVIKMKKEEKIETKKEKIQ